MPSGFSSIWDECSQQDDTSRTRQRGASCQSSTCGTRWDREARRFDSPGCVTGKTVPGCRSGRMWTRVDPEEEEGGRETPVEDTVCAQTQALAGTAQQKSGRVTDSSGPRGPAGTPTIAGNGGCQEASQLARRKVFSLLLKPTLGPHQPRSSRVLWKRPVPALGWAPGTAVPLAPRRASWETNRRTPGFWGGSIRAEGGGEGFLSFLLLLSSSHHNGHASDCCRHP